MRKNAESIYVVLLHRSYWELRAQQYIRVKDWQSNNSNARESLKAEVGEEENVIEKQ